MSAVRQLRPDQPTDERRELLRIIRDRSFKSGAFTLASGRTSTRYFDLKPTMMSARGAYLAARAFLDEAAAQAADVVGGLEMGAVPIIGAMAAIGEVEKRPVTTFFVRKEVKGHGTRKLVEGLADGETLADRRILLVDDVATSGMSMMKAVEPVREAKGVIVGALVLVDREEGAESFLAERGVRLLSLFRASEFD